MNLFFDLDCSDLFGEMRKEGDDKRNTLTEFNSNNTRRLNLQETIDTIAKLSYIQERLVEE